LQAERRTSRRQASRRLRWLLPAAVLAVILAAVLLRAASEHVPPVRARRTLSAQVTLPGRPPALAWPQEGQAAVEVEGVGSLGAFGGNTPVPIASVAKMMTAYLTLRAHPLSAGQSGFVITVSAAQAAEEHARAAEGQSVVPVRAGERLSERQALQALMLPSANNVAAMLAVHEAGSIDEFVAQMNAQARALRMRATTYTDPSGFLDTTLSTASDQLKLVQAAMSIPTFAQIVDTSAAQLPVAGVVHNYDDLVGEEGYVGVKTGSDGPAGGCLAFAKRVSVDGHRFMVLGVVLGQRHGELIEAALDAAHQLGNSAAAALRVRTALPAGTGVLTLTAADGQHAAVRTSRQLKAIGWPGMRVPVTVAIGHAGASVEKGQRLAHVRIKGAIGASTAAVANSALAKPSFGWRLDHLL
jgi:D-alanyl-D-alanine carboxypeptidase (penicillin-binding protein 5/6)